MNAYDFFVGMAYGVGLCLVLLVVVQVSRKRKRDHVIANFLAVAEAKDRLIRSQDDSDRLSKKLIAALKELVATYAEERLALLDFIKAHGLRVPSHLLTTKEQKSESKPA